jgi:hypothetical protein
MPQPDALFDFRERQGFRSARKIHRRSLGTALGPSTGLLHISKDPPSPTLVFRVNLKIQKSAFYLLGFSRGRGLGTNSSAGCCGRESACEHRHRHPPSAGDNVGHIGCQHSDGGQAAVTTIHGRSAAATAGTAADRADTVHQAVPSSSTDAAALDHTGVNS